MTASSILGDGPLGPGGRDRRARARRRRRASLGRPADGRHDRRTSPAPTSSSRPRAATRSPRTWRPRSTPAAAGSSSPRPAGRADRPTVEALLREHGAAAVAAPNFSLGVALFGRLVEAAAACSARSTAFEPYIVEWHRRAKRDRPSGTARRPRPADRRRATRASADADDLEVVSVRAGASPGMHLVGFDAAGETVELRLTARDRSAYAAGILAAADWLRRDAARPPASTPSTRSWTSSSLAAPIAACPPDHPRPTRRSTAMTRIARPRPTRPPSAAPSPPSSPRSPPTATLDEAAFRRLVRWQVLAGIDGLVPCGTTGESPTLSTDERERLIARDRRGRRASGRRATASAVVAGTGTNDTAATIAATRRAAELGADAALVVAPYYNRPDQRMLEAHFRAIADEGDLPIVVYNVPSRTGTNVEADTFLRLAEHPRVVAVKEASGNLEQIARICRDRPRDVAVLAGDDAWTLPILAMGGDGVVSVASQRDPGRDGRAVRRGPGRRLGRRRGGSTSAGCRCSWPTSGAARTRSRRRPRSR